MQRATLRLASALVEPRNDGVTRELATIVTAARALQLPLVEVAAERVARLSPERPVLSGVALRTLLAHVEVRARHIEAARAAQRSPVRAFPSFVVDAYAALVRGATVWPSGLPSGDGPVAIAARATWHLEQNDVERALIELRDADAELAKVRQIINRRLDVVDFFCFVLFVVLVLYERYRRLMLLSSKRVVICICVNWSL